MEYEHVSAIVSDLEACYISCPTVGHIYVSGPNQETCTYPQSLYQQLWPNTRMYDLHLIVFSFLPISAD